MPTRVTNARTVLALGRLSLVLQLQELVAQLPLLRKREVSSVDNAIRVSAREQLPGIASSGSVFSAFGPRQPAGVHARRVHVRGRCRMRARPFSWRAGARFASGC